MEVIPGMDFNWLKKKLDNCESIPNFLIFTGEEREVQLQYIKRVDKNAHSVDNVSKLPELMSFGNLLKKKKTFVVTDNLDIFNLDSKQLKKLTKNNRLIVVMRDMDKKRKFYKDNKESIVEFTKFTPDQLVGYITQRLNISDGLAFGLAVLCNNEVSRIDNEVDKLNMLGSPITEELLSDLIVPPLEDAIFEMIDNTAGGNPERAFEILSDLLEQKESPIKIVSLLYTKFKQIFLVQSMQDYNDRDIASKTTLSFWQVQRTREICNKFSFETLVEILKGVQDFEIKMKTGGIDQYVGIVGLMTRILSMG